MVRFEKKLFFILLILVLTSVIMAIFCLIMARRAENKADDKAEQESETITEEYSEATTEERSETVVVDDGVSGLYDALKESAAGADADMAKAIEAFSEAAKQGNSDAMYFLGEIYFQGIGVEPDFEKAGEYFKNACESGSKKAMSIYGKMLFMGDGIMQNYDESASCFYTVAESDAEAAYMIAIMSNLGMGMPRSADRAAKYLDKAIELGYEKAQDYKSKVYDGGKDTDGTSDFKLAAKKVKELEYKTEYDDLQNLIEKYHSMVKETERYDAFDAEAKALLDVDLIGASTITLFGNNGYLFHQNENDGTSLHDYIGDNRFSEKELEAVAKNLEGIKKWVEGKGSKFVLLLIPNKETLFPEYMPSCIKRLETVTRQDLLVEYLRENTDIEVVYTKDTLSANKDKFPIYYKTDTHSNMVGSLFMMSDLFKACYGVEITPDLSKFDIHLRDYMGDLGRMAKCTGKYASDKVYFYPERSVGDEDKIESSMMLVGDSFSEFISIEAEYYLNGGFDHRMVTEYNLNYRSATEAGFKDSTPEYVVWEIVERYLDRLK